MGCQGKVQLGNNLTFSVCTHDPDTGVLTDADAVPSYRLYETETDPPILNGNMAKLDDDDTTGFYTETVACTAGNGFEAGKSYTIYIEATVDSDKGGICYGFLCEDLADVDDIHDEVVEGAYTFRQLIRLMVSALLGDTEDNGLSYRDLADSKDRYNVTIDANSNRDVTINDAT